MVRIEVGGRSRRSGEEEAGGLARRQHHALVAARLVRGGVCDYVLRRTPWESPPQISSSRPLSEVRRQQLGH